MAHVELSLTESFLPSAQVDQANQVQPVEATGNTLERWAGAVLHAAEPSMIIDSREVIVAASSACCELLSLGDPASATGRYLLDVVHLVDFTAAQSELTEPEIANIPPLLALSSCRLARGLLRVHCPDRPCTVDAISTPLRDGEQVVGSLTFFAPI